MNITLGLLVALLGLLGVQSWRLGLAHDELKAERAAAVSAALLYAENARKVEDVWAVKFRGVEDAKTNALRLVRDDLDGALERLRDRPERRAESATATAAACTGATGAELSGSDAAFLARKAARADTLRAELGACQERERALE